MHRGSKAVRAIGAATLAVTLSACGPAQVPEDVIQACARWLSADPDFGGKFFQTFDVNDAYSTPLESDSNANLRAAGKRARLLGGYEVYRIDYPTSVASNRTQPCLVAKASDGTWINANADPRIQVLLSGGRP